MLHLTSITLRSIAKSDVDEVKVLEPRTEAPMDLERRPHLVHVYGA